MEDFIVMTLEEARNFAEDARFKNSGKILEWQCPSCKHRCLNLQRQTNNAGKPLWGCQKFCDTNDEAYFAGRACNCYEKGDSYLVWP